MWIGKREFSANQALGLTLISIAICMNLLITSYAQEGFLSIDCGSNRAKYNDSFGLTWVTDNGTYIKTGTSFNQSSVNWAFINSTAGAGNEALQSFRYFPEPRSKYCYELETKSNASFLIRASFYMNEKEVSKRNPFQFVTYINATEWFTLKSGDGGQSDLFVSQEAIFHSPGGTLYFCLQPIVGVPFISSLELRQLDPTIYSYSGDRLQYLALLFRYNLGSNTTTPEVVRFPDDSYDRIWQRPPSPYPEPISSFSKSTPSNTTTGKEVNYVPPKVMQDAWLFLDNNTAAGMERETFSLYTEQVFLAAMEYALAVVYAENLNSSNSQPYIMDILLDYDINYENGYGAIVGPSITVSNQAIMQSTPNVLLSGSEIEIYPISPSDSNYEGSLPLNAFEVYAQFNYNFSTTNVDDGNPATLHAVILMPVAADPSKWNGGQNFFTVLFSTVQKGVAVPRSAAATMHGLKTNLSMSDWQGDPCTPVPYDWISCSCDACDERQAYLLSGYTVVSMTLSNLAAGLASSLFNTNSPAFGFQGLISMTTFSITNSQVDSSAFGNMVNALVTLTSLDVSFNVIDSIPEATDWNTSYLMVLNLSHNHLTKLDPFENEVFLATLNTLDLSHNAMTSLPSKWVNTTNNLTVLDLSHNQIEGAISSLDQLIEINNGSLQELYVSNNKLGGEFSSSLYFSGLSQFTIGIFDQNAIEGTLNLSAWYETLQTAAAIGNLTKSNVTLPLFSFVNNSISDIFPSATTFTAVISMLMKDSSFSPYGILLGGNPYCKSAKSYTQKYLCRYTIHDNVPETKKDNHLIIIISSCLVTLLFLICCVTYVIMWRLWKKVREMREIQQALADQKVQPPFYKYNDLKLATRDFHKDKKLGQGGFGIVYKGELEDSTLVGVKKLFNSQKVQVLNEFLNEVVLITGIKHRNLVQLKGCCIQDRQRMLVYEYAENGNLAQALWDQENHNFLDWKQRFNICVGIARGLSYLHEELQPSIIHRDIKPANILLDTNFQPKIADFGLARNSSNESSEVLFTKVAGTFGYFAPEYATLGELSNKVDVYSYGIVVLEVISGRKCIDNNQPVERRFLKYWVENMHKKGLLLDVLEPKLRDNCTVDDVIQAINIALLCVQQDPTRRPSMSQVVTLFMGNMNVEAIVEPQEDSFNYGGLSTSCEMPFPTTLATTSTISEEDCSTSPLLWESSQSAFGISSTRPQSRFENYRTSSNGVPAMLRSRSMIEMSVFLR